GAKPAAAAGAARKNWVSIAIEQDLAFVGAGSGICSPAIQTSGEWSCFRGNGSQYHGNPVSKGDAVNGGFSPATTRILVGFDRVIAAGLVAGVRGGVVVRGGGPSPDATFGSGFFPGHVEGRVAYFLGSDPFGSTGFHPFVDAAFGAAAVDVPFQTPVREDVAHPARQTNPRQQTLDAWRHMGTGFAGGGLGAMYAIAPRVGPVLDLQYRHFFPTSGNVLSPELAFAVGF
ncbi:MAG TPA: hypothetical protein VHB21_18195, partial [Minicystis sp.]|nr:hypothetical protein [Minicystis sp.]